MSTHPRLSALPPGAAPDFGSVMAHAPEVLTSFFALYASFWQSGGLDARIKEITRLRNARVTDCGY